MVSPSVSVNFHLQYSTAGKDLQEKYGNFQNFLRIVVLISCILFVCGTAWQRPSRQSGFACPEPVCPMLDKLPGLCYNECAGTFVQTLSVSVRRIKHIHAE